MKKKIISGITMIAIAVITVITMTSLSAEQFCTQGSTGICVPTVQPPAFSCGWTMSSDKDCGGVCQQDLKDLSSHDQYVI
ncbi:MAG: hypothetical protein LBD91_04845 [Prevotellaceae bacterium]|jgi:hypothetical protein|nr:hypothetical protein [Prevotellaceae bacterium]